MQEVSKEEDTLEKFSRDTLMASVLIIRKLEEVKEIIPERLPDGSYSYPALDDLKLGFNYTDLLNRMTKMGLISKTLEEMIMVCPKCQRSNITHIIRCSKCGSRTIIKENIMEHIPEGHILPESEFRKTGRLVCPTCNKLIMNENEYRIIGSEFSCLKCGERHTQITPQFRCIDDGTIFNVMTADFKPLYGYTLTDKALSFLQIDKNYLMDFVAKILAKKFNVERNVSMQGKSGVKHVFDIIASNGKRTALIDIAFSKDDVADSAILASYTKIFDTGIRDYTLIIWPKLQPSAQSLATFYNIKIIEASTLDALQDKVKSSLSSEVSVQSAEPDHVVASKQDSTSSIG